MMNFLNKN